jgi:hypothetical protein
MCGHEMAVRRQWLMSVCLCVLWCRCSERWSHAPSESVTTSTERAKRFYSRLGRTRGYRCSPGLERTCSSWRATKTASHSAPESKCLSRWPDGYAIRLTDNSCHMLRVFSGNFGLWLDGDLFHGRSHPCKTFGNTSLSIEEDFVVKGIECWAFVWELIHSLSKWPLIVWQ